MATYEFDRIMTAADVKSMIEKDFDSSYHVNVNLKKSRVEISDGAVNGCGILVQEKNGKTICRTYGYMPSGGLRAVIAVLFVPGGVALGLWTNVWILSALGPVVAVLLMKVPAQGFVARIGDILAKAATVPG